MRRTRRALVAAATLLDPLALVGRSSASRPDGIGRPTPEDLPVIAEPQKVPVVESVVAEAATRRRAPWRAALGTANRRFVATALAILGIAGMGIASAATLNLTTAPLGAGAQIVATCQGGAAINVGFEVTWDDATDTYKVSAVNLTNLNANCVGDKFHLQLRAGATSLGPSITGNIPTNGKITIDANQQNAAQVTDVSLVIVG